MCQSNIIVAFFPYITSTSDIYLLRLLKEIITAKSLTATKSLIVHDDYQYASSQFLRHVNSTGRPLESSESSTIPCTCLSELASIPDMPKLTSDDHASLVIRVIICIAAQHHPTETGQCERDQISDFVSAG